MKTKLIVKSKRYPKFITSHKIFSKFDEVEKIFPLIGLSNASMPVMRLNYQDQAAKLFKQTAISAIWPYDIKLANSLKKISYSEFISNHKFRSPIEQNLNRLYLSKRYPPIYYGNIYINNNHIYGFYRELPIDHTTKVVFSSANKNGMWDIATMSMRGFTSCQSWNGCYKRNLIGSMVDPFLGIIYITDGTRNKKGPKMLRRALVRYVVHSRTHKPALFLERVYPHSTYTQDPQAVAIFTAYLTQHTNLPVITSSYSYVIPNSKIVQKMSSCGKFADGKDFCRSYRDSGIGYTRSRKIYYPNIKAF